MTKKDLRERMAKHVEESLQIRNEIIKIIKNGTNLKDDKEIIDIIKRGSFDKVHILAETLIPNDKKVVTELKKDDVFINPFGSEILTFVEGEKVHNDEMYLIDATSENRRIETYLFKCDEKVEII